MKLKDILLERLSSIVYHATSLLRLNQILAKDMMIASPLFTRDDEKSLSHKSYFFVSTARSRTSPFILTLLNSGKSVGVLTLDGDKLNQNYKGKSVNYFLNRKNNEMEDRLFTDEQYIKNISEYIEQVSILVVGKPTQTMIEIKQLCKEKNIPIFFFKTKEDLISNNKNKSIDIENSVVNDEDKTIKTEKQQQFPKNLDALLYFYENDNPRNVPKKYQEYIQDLTIDYYKKSWINVLRKELNQYYRNENIIKFFKDILKNERVYSIDELVDKISNKWKTTIKKVA